MLIIFAYFQKGKSIKFWSFNPSSFRNIRLTYGISDSEYIKLFGATTKVIIYLYHNLALKVKKNNRLD